MRRTSWSGPVVLLAILSEFVCAAPASPTIWSPVINIDPGTQENDRYPIPAITPDGTAWVFWHSYDPIELDPDVYYSRWDGRSWSPRATVNPPNTTSDDIVRVSCASDGTLWTLWRAPRLDGSDGYLGLTSRWLNGAWSWPDTVWSDANRYNNTDLFAVSSDEAWFIRDASGGDALAYHVKGGVHEPAYRFDLPSAAAYQPTIAVDAGGVVWAAWTHEEPYPYPGHLEFSRCVNGVWTTPRVVPIPVYTELPRLSVDRDDTKWLVCAGDDPTSSYRGSDVWALRWNGSDWTPTRISDPIQSNDSLQVWNAVSRTPGEYPRVVWMRANVRNYTRRDILTTAWNGTEWSPVELAGNLADSSYTEWPEVAVRGGLTWVTWMADVGTRVYNIMSTHSVDVADLADLDLAGNPVGILVAWSTRASSATGLAIHRATGRFDASEVFPPPGSTAVAELDHNRVKAGSLLDRGTSPGVEYSYWLEIQSGSAPSSWVGPMVGAMLARPQSTRHLAVCPTSSPGSVVFRGSGGGSLVDVRVFDVQGRLVRRIPVSRERGGGTTSGGFEAAWDGQSQFGTAAPAGVYFALPYGHDPQWLPVKFILIR